MTDQTTAPDTQNNQTSFDVLAELRLAVQIFDHAAGEGAFKGWGVINEVLGCRGRLVAIIDLMQQALTPPVDPDAATAPDQTAPVASETPAPETAEATVSDDSADKLAEIQQKKEAYMKALADLDAEAGTINP